MVHFCIYPYVLWVSQSIERILNSAKLWHHQQIQYGGQDGCLSEYYSNSVDSYPREIPLVSIPRLSRLLRTLEQLLLRSDGYVIVKFHGKRSLNLRFIKFYFFINNYSWIHHFKHSQFEWVGQFKWQPSSYNNCWILWATRTKLKRNILLHVYPYPSKPF